MNKTNKSSAKRGQPWWLNQDPVAGADGHHYDNIIPSRSFIIKYLSEQAGPLPFEELARLLKLDEGGKVGLERRLGAMCRDGQLLQNRSDAFAPVGDLDLIAGRVIAHRDGFGFLVPEDGGDDLFMHAKQMARLYHGDRVIVRVRGVDQRGRREGAIVEIIERNTTEITGRFHSDNDVYTVVPDNPRLLHAVNIPANKTRKAKPGQIVTAKIIDQPRRFGNPVGEVVEVLGEHMAPGLETEVALRSHNIPHEWPEAVDAEAAKIPSTVPSRSKNGRLDLRDFPLVTIDGEDARDFDDAVFAEPHNGGWKLWVAIADVAEYVKPDSALDIEALARGNSCYFPSRVVPMLPEVLSNGLCSINPKVDRLCMVCEMDVSKKGKVKKSVFHEAVMRSHARLTYNKVAAMLVDHDESLRSQYADVLPHVEELYDLYKVLRKARETRGAMDFDTVETRIVFNDDKKVEKIVPVVRNDAHMLIEECMIAANVEAAKFLDKNNCPTLHRNHKGPQAEKLENLKTFLFSVGLSIGGGDKPQPSDYLQLSNEIKDRPDRQLIQTVMLRSLSQAAYGPQRIGHFGLATDYYAHFTSPIRRYPDLLVHRAIKHLIHSGSAKATVGRTLKNIVGRGAGKSFAVSTSKMAQFGEQCSLTERRADEATREVMDWLKCEFMVDKVGKTFTGKITSVTGFGLFVQLEDIFVEGLVHVSSLASDFYHHDPAHHVLQGKRSGKNYRLGDKIEITVANVSLDERKVDFAVAGTEAGSQRKRKPSGGNKGAGKQGGNRRGSSQNKKIETKPAAGSSKGPRKRKKRSPNE